jgi:nucleoside-diphosphate-sugar epimerase
MSGDRRVLVTGATGFVGRRVVPMLAAAGDEVHAVCRTDPSMPASGAMPATVTWHRCDLLDGAELDRLVADVSPTHVLHLAWCTTPPDYWTSPENERWARATGRLARAFAASGGARFVGAGTGAEYATGGQGPFSELTTPARANTVYGRCKHAAHAEVERVADTLGLSMAWGRIFFAYGPGEHPTRLVPSVVRSLLRGRPAECTNGRQVRDLIHVDDVASAFTRLLASDLEGPVNIACGNPVPIALVATTLGELCGRPDLIHLGARPTAADEPGAVVADVTRLRTELGWQPRYTLEEGLGETIDWWRARSVPAATRRR